PMLPIALRLEVLPASKRVIAVATFTAARESSLSNQPLNGLEPSSRIYSASIRAAPIVTYSLLLTSHFEEASGHHAGGSALFEIRLATQYSRLRSAAAVRGAQTTSPSSSACSMAR